MLPVVLGIVILCIFVVSPKLYSYYSYRKVRNDRSLYAKTYCQVVKIYPRLECKTFVIQEYLRKLMRSGTVVTAGNIRSIVYSFTHSIDAVLDKAIRDCETGDGTLNEVLVAPYYEHPWPKRFPLSQDVLNMLYGLALDFTMVVNANGLDLICTNAYAPALIDTILQRVAPTQSVASMVYTGPTTPVPELRIHLLDRSNFDKEQETAFLAAAGSTILTLSASGTKIIGLDLGYNLRNSNLGWYKALVFESADLSELFGNDTSNSNRWSLRVCEQRYLSS